MDEAERVPAGSDEPVILLIGRLLATLEVLAEELRRHGRIVHTTNQKTHLQQLLAEDKIDFVVMGAGLADEIRDDLETFLARNHPHLPVHLLPRTPDANPAQVIALANEQAVLFKIRRVPGQDGRPRTD